MLDKLKMVSGILDKAGIDHAIIGGLALAAHGVQRFTNDIDFILEGEQRLVAKSSLLAHGFRLHFESHEVMQFTGDVDVDIILANRPMSQSMLKEAKALEPFTIKTVGVEALIGLKIQAYSNDKKREYKDKADIAALIEKAESIDWNQIKVYADLFDQWDEILSIKEKMEAP